MTGDRIRHSCTVPADAVPAWAFEIVSFLSGDGDPLYIARIAGWPQASTLLGHLRLIEHDLIAAYRGDPGASAVYFDDGLGD